MKKKMKAANRTFSSVMTWSAARKAGAPITAKTEENDPILREMLPIIRDVIQEQLGFKTFDEDEMDENLFQNMCAYFGDQLAPRDVLRYMNIALRIEAAKEI